ncbi:COX15/CtaA family protein [Planomonospora venezuelensis]|uniref:Cytochrome c oxidase assembly protein subunit 15 n=1 Tax=Planomonospora venezuelensis TaxID=1999 RepID=A0A841D5K6_PLAVE|nr:cytochrome c oxidase assembly protein subunit 15 [Planomonospora venezuelensis]GIN05517.1 cytochrome b561 [Planomonospora venezuelensis]
MNQLLDPIRRPVAPLFRTVWSPTAATMRWWALIAVAVNAGITVTGAVVRVTGSGLGCPTWPRCTPDSFVPAAHDGISPLNTAIEFGNRLLTFLVLVVALACLAAALRLPERRRDLVRLAWLQPVGVAVQALWGGVVVHSALNPVTVNVHFLFSIGMIAAACALYARAGEGDAPAQRLVHRDIRTLGYVLVGAVLLLILAGMVVTGTGPHSGDEMASRFDFDIETVARIHADVAYLVVGLTFALLFALHVTDVRGGARRAALTLLAVELAQGVIGYVQYFLAVPAFLVGLHVLGSTLVWICTLRVAFAMRVRGPLGVPAGDAAGLGAVPV